MRKIILLVLILFCNLSYSQTRRIKLPLLVQNTEVDSLMNIVTTNSKIKDVCFSFTAVDVFRGYFFMVLRLNKNPSNIFSLSPLTNDVHYIGYFTIRGYTVFVSSDKEQTPYFKQKPINKVFDVAFLKDTVNWFKPDSLVHGDPENRNGQFFFVSKSARELAKPHKQKK